MTINNDPLLTTLQLDWDTNGSIRHRFEDTTSLSFSKKQSLLAMSMPVLVSSQIGALSVNRSLVLCHHLLNFLSHDEIAIEPINSALSSSYIKFHQGENIYQLFFTRKSETADTANVEDGIRQMICNFAWHVNNTVSEELSQQMRDETLISLHFYLTEALPLVASNSDFNANNNYPEVHKKTVELSFFLPKENPTFHSRERFNEVMTETRNAYERFQKAIFKPRSLDGMSDVEKYKLITEELLPAMRKIALEKQAERDVVMKKTMAYVKQATKERDRNIAIQRVFWVLFILIIVGLMCYMTR